MTKRELKKLRKKLPKGWANTLAAKYQHSVSYIRAILYGQKINPPIVSNAIEMANNYQAELKLSSEKIKQL